ncbi:NmrA family NAD(P)-binding protein [Kutzneria sp. CA-103260]|uniref:NmrA family NAD(P)-binding protein n=1 Tax=Kutzneria sp. CA-103260 TaxID=2802641 RepID=UPI001BAA442E|nr:NAD(P)H-binding protein [Kutzneria sp. CA-103260]QUQ67141.1 SDR family oxidoreductase [Kutzneria sp. CA-103260]
MIVITGATGALGGATVEHLLERIPADRLGVSVRDVAKAQHFADRGVRVRRGSYDDPTALRDSFEGADQVLLVSQNDPDGDGIGLHRNAIEAAVAAGAQRILYTSHQNARADSPFDPAHEHAATEALLADSGVAWTSLRNGFYAHSLDWLLGPWRQTGVIATPADGPVSWTDRADAAEAAAIILTRQHPFDGPVTLTARRAVTFADIATTTTELTGRDITRAVIADETWLADRIATGTPEPMAHMLLRFFHAARSGHFADTDPLLAELLGREPRTVADLLTDRISA